MYRTNITQYILFTQTLHFTHTYLLKPWSRVLLEKLLVLQLIKKFPAFYGTRKFITVLTSARQLSFTLHIYLLTRITCLAYKATPSFLTAISERKKEALILCSRFSGTCICNPLTCYFYTFCTTYLLRV